MHIHVHTPDAPELATAVAAAMADIRDIAEEEDDPELIVRVHQITLRYGYWWSPEEHSDGRLWYQADEPEWWADRADLPYTHHGWAYQTDLAPGPDYWIVVDVPASTT